MRIISVLILLLTMGIAAWAQQSLKPGAAAPDFEAESIDGKQYSLSGLQGKIVVLTFWSTRCEICHHEIPKLNQIADRYRNNDVVFLGLTADNDAKVEPYLRKNPFNFSIVPNSFGVLLKYADMDAGGTVKIGFPAYFLIGRDGKIIQRADGWDKTEKLNSQISKMIAVTD